MLAAAEETDNARLARPRLITNQLTLLLVVIAASNFAFWLLWPDSIVRLERGGYGPLLAGLFGATALVALLGALLIVPRALVRWCPRKVTMAAVALVGAGALVMLTGSGLAFTLAGSGLIGFGTGARWVSVDSWIATDAPDGMRGRALAMGEVVTGLTFAAGPAFAGAAGGPAAAVLACAMPIIAFGAAWLARDPQGGAATTASVSGQCEKSVFSALWIVLPAAFLGGSTESGFAAAAPLLALDAGHDREFALGAAALVGLGSFVAQFGLGAAADRYGGLEILRLCAALSSAALVALAVMPATLPAVAFVLGAFGGGLYTVAVVYGLQRSSTTASRLIACAATGYVLGTAAAPPVAGWALATVGARSFALVLALAGALLFFWIWLCTSRELHRSAGRVQSQERSS